MKSKSIELTLLSTVSMNEMCRPNDTGMNSSDS